jgi:hypothetical protein
MSYVICNKINHKRKTRKDQSAYAIYVNEVKSPDLVLGIVTIWNIDEKTHFI